MSATIDYHVHTDNSYDCQTRMEDMCRRAVERGLTEIAFTDHFNNHKLDLDLGFYRADRYFADLERCRTLFPTLILRAGIEVGEPHRHSEKLIPLLEQYPYDLVLGSLHRIGNESVFNPNYFRARGYQKAYEDYFAELTQMVRHGGFNILTHVDLPKRVGFDVFQEYDISQFEESVRALWAACIESGITPEINTKGARCSVAELHPSPIALHWYAEMGGRALTLGSDAHQADGLGDHFEEARRGALDAGLTHVCRFEQGARIGWSAL